MGRAKQKIFKSLFYRKRENSANNEMEFFLRTYTMVYHLSMIFPTRYPCKL